MVLNVDFQDGQDLHPKPNVLAAVSSNLQMFDVVSSFFEPKTFIQSMGVDYFHLAFYAEGR